MKFFCTRTVVPRRHSRIRPLGFAAMALALLSAAETTQAASGTWNGTTDGLWSAANGANWSGTPPGSTTVTNSADTATFNNAGNGNTTITIDPNRNIKSLTFDTGAASYTIGSAGANLGNGLILTSGGAITLAATVTGTNVVETINAPLTLMGSYTFTNARADAGSALVFAGNITNGATSTLTISGAGTGTGNLISGNISDGVGVQSVSITATNGTWTLSGANSYSGLTTINGIGGTVVLSGTNNSSGGTTLSNGTLQLNNATNGGLASGTLTLNAGTLQALNAGRTLSNAVTLASVTVSGSQSLTINGKTTGLTGASRTLTSSITDAGTLTLGDLDLNTETANTRSLTMAGTGNTTVNGVIANGNATRAHNLIVTNTGTTTFRGANTYTGTTTIGASNAANAGTLRLSDAGTLGAGLLTIFGGTLDINGLTRTLSTGTLTLGGGAAGSSANILIGAGGVLTLGGNVTFSATNNANGATISGGTLNLGGARTFTIGDSTNATADLTINSLIGDGNGIFDATKAGNGTLVYAQTTALGSLTSATPTATVSAGTLQIDGAITGGNGIFDVVKAGTGLLNYTAAIALTADQTARVASGAGTVQLSGVISGNGFGLTATTGDTGTLVLTAANTYTGATTVNGGGTLKLSGGAGSVGNSDVTVSSSTSLIFDSSASGVTGATRAKSVTLVGNGSSGTVFNSLTVAGNSGANSTDIITNALTFTAGVSEVTITPDAATNTRLHAGSFVRNPGGAAFFRGTNLGANTIASATANAANISFVNTPALIGGGGAAASTTMSILPGAFGDTSASGTGNGTATGGLVTYDTARGIRLLDPVTEYKSAITDLQTALDNVRYVNTSGAGVVTTTLTIDTTINSLSFNITGASGGNSGVVVTGSAGTTLTINSGVIYASSNVPATGATANDGPVISVPILSLGGREGTIVAFTPTTTSGSIGTAALLNISSSITNDGGKGVTLSGNSTQGTNAGEVQFSGTAANSYTGTTTVNGILLKLAKSGGVNAIPGDLVLNAGSIYDGGNQIADTSHVTINGGTFYQNGSNNSGSSTSETIGSLTLNGGTISPGQGSGNTLTINGTMTLNGSGFTMAGGAKLNVGGVATFAGGTLTVGGSSSPSTFTGITTFSSDVVITNTAGAAYVPITVNAGSANLGGRVLLSGNLTFNGNATNTNTTSINVAAGTQLGVMALNGTRTFNIGDGAAAVDLTINTALTDNGVTAGGVTKGGVGTLKLTGANTYTGPTVVTDGVLEISGSLSGSATAPVSVDKGTLLLSANNALNNAAMGLTLGDDTNGTSGALKLSDSLSSATETFGNLSLEYHSTIDFGAGTGNSLLFAGVGSHTSGMSLTILGWSGTGLQAGGAGNDRLIFTGSDLTAFTNAYAPSNVSFNGLTGYSAIQIDAGHYEIVAVPEPSARTLALTAGLLGLTVFRRRRRSFPQPTKPH